MAILARVGLVPAGAASTHADFRAPYAAANRNGAMTCKPGDLAPSCTSSSSSDPATGTMTASASVDSGALGTLPGRAFSEADGSIVQSVPVGDATAVVFTLHLHVNRDQETATGMGSSNTVVEGSAACDGCSVAYESYAFPNWAPDQTLDVAIVRPGGAAHTVTLTVMTSAAAGIECDDFCIAPRGAASASSQVVLTRVDVTLWGVGRPVPPTISAPGAGAVISPSTSEQIVGQAEPGMPVVITEGPNVLGRVQADANGNWAVDVARRAGAHTVVATAEGPDGTAASAPRSFSVVG